MKFKQFLIIIGFMGTIGSYLTQSQILFTINLMCLSFNLYNYGKES